MTINQAILAAGMAAFILLGQPARAHADAGTRGGGCGQSRQDMKDHGLDRMTRFLGLSTEQQQAMKAVEDKYGPEMRELRQLSFDNRKALDKMDASDPKLQELAAAQGKTLADMMVLRKQMRAQMEQTLTDAQRQKLKTLYEHRREQRGHPGAWQERMGPS